MRYREIQQKLVPITAVRLVSFAMLYRQSVAYDRSDDKHIYCYPGWYSCAASLAEGMCHLAYMPEDDGEPREIFSHIEELEGMGLSAPAISYILRDLKEAGFPIEGNALTVEEARDMILGIFRRGHV